MHWSLYLVPLVPYILATYPAMRQERKLETSRSPSIKKVSDKSEAQLKQLQKDNKSLKTTNTVALTGCAILVTLLAAKTIRSGSKLRNAYHDARAWRRVTMTMIKREENPFFQSPHQPHSRSIPSLDEIRKKSSTSPAGLGRFQNNMNAARKPKGMKLDEKKMNVTDIFGKKDDVWEKVLAELEAVGQESSVAKVGGKESSSGTLMSTPSKTVPTMSSQWHKVVSSPSSITRGASSSNPLYSAVHPHEDWDWVPADHPPARNSWKRNQLPPWTVGFSSAPKSQANSSSSEGAEMSTKQDESSDLEELLLRSAIWPDSDPLKSSEAAFIVDEVYKDLSNKKQHQQLQRPEQSSTVEKQSEPAQNKVSDCKKELLNSKPWTESDSQKRNETVLIAEQVFKDLGNSKRQQSIRYTAAIKEEMESEKVKALERQVWALLARSQALEDKLLRRR